MKSQKKILLVFFLVALLISLLKEIKALPQAQPEASLRPIVTEYKAEGLKDPFEGKEEQFIAQAKAQAKAQEVVPEVPVQRRPLPALPPVQGLVWGGRFPQAIINDKVVKIGETIDEAKEVRVIDINKSGITVSFDNQQYTRPSPAEIILQSSKQNPTEGGKDEK
jgi:hypothetical protein